MGIFAALQGADGLRRGSTKCGEKTEEAGDDKGEDYAEKEDAPIGGEIKADGVIGRIDGTNDERSGPGGEKRAESRREKGEDATFDKNELDKLTASGTDGDTESHFPCARGSMRDHEIGDVGASDEEHEENENAKCQEGAAIVVLEARGAGRGWLEVEGLINFEGGQARCFTDIRFGAFGFESAGNGVELGTKRFESDARTDESEGAVPGGVLAGDARMHHGGEEQVDHGAWFGAGEGRLRNAYDLKDVVADAEGFTEDMGIVGETARPVIVGDDSDGMRAGSGVVIRGEEPAEGGLQAEGGEHVAGDVLEMGFFHFPIGFVGEIDTLHIRDGQEISLL